MNHVLPAAAGLGFVLFGLWTLQRATPALAGAWRFAAALSLLFAAFSLWAVVQEGPLGFWPEHTRNLWGQQIWFDLLLAAGTAWAALLPRARALGMRPAPWLLAVVCTGSIGLLAMLARLLYLRERSART
jgi:predicted anti-sigma-YlaC factor YlaD